MLLSELRKYKELQTQVYSLIRGRKFCKRINININCKKCRHWNLRISRGKYTRCCFQRINQSWFFWVQTSIEERAIIFNLEGVIWLFEWTLWYWTFDFLWSRWAILNVGEDIIERAVFEDAFKFNFSLVTIRSTNSYE